MRKSARSFVSVITFLIKYQRLEKIKILRNGALPDILTGSVDKYEQIYICINRTTTVQVFIVQEKIP